MNFFYNPVIDYDLSFRFISLEFPMNMNRFMLITINLEKSVESRILAQALDSTALQKNTRLTYGWSSDFFKAL